MLVHMAVGHTVSHGSQASWGGESMQFLAKGICLTDFRGDSKRIPCWIQIFEVRNRCGKELKMLKLMLIFKCLFLFMFSDI